MQAAVDHGKETETAWGGEFARQRGTPYGMHRDWLVAPTGLPCNAPPWGALVAFDLNTGKLRWEVAARQSWATAAPAGSISLGGPMATAGGLIFTAAAIDPHLRAFDADTGKEVVDRGTARQRAIDADDLRMERQAVHRDLRRRPRQDEEQDGRLGGGVRAGVACAMMAGWIFGR